MRPLNLWSEVSVEPILYYISMQKAEFVLWTEFVFFKWINFPTKLILILGTASFLLCHDYEGQKKKQVDSMTAYQNIRFFPIDSAVDTGGVMETRLSPRKIFFSFSSDLFVGKSCQNGLDPFEKSWMYIKILDAF